MRTLRILLPLLVVLPMAVPSAASAAATATWVSGVGDDVNPCSRTAPCKTFAGAISKTTDAGTIRALDPGGFGAVTITKSLTITGDGTLAEILNTASNGIVVNAAETDDIVLRNLSINGGGACTGLNGVRVLSANSVTLQDVTINGSNGAAVEIAPTANPIQVVLDRVRFQDNCGFGVKVAPVAAQTASVLVLDSTITRSGAAVHVAAGGSATIVRSTIFGNPFGLQFGTPPGTIDLSHDSVVRGNGTDGAPTGTFGQPGPTGPAGPAGPAGAVVERLLVVPAESRARVRRGARVLFDYLSTKPGRSLLTISRRGTRVTRIVGTVRRGSNVAAWNGRVGRSAVAPGTYVLRLQVRDNDGQVVVRTFTAVIVAPRR